MTNLNGRDQEVANEVAGFVGKIVENNLANGSDEQIPAQVAEVLSAVGLGYGINAQRDALTREVLKRASLGAPINLSEIRIAGPVKDRCGNPIKICGQVVEEVKDKCGNPVKGDRCGNPIVGTPIGGRKIRDKHGDIYYGRGRTH